MNGKEFWLRWRVDIMRGALLFALVLGVGLVVQSMVRRGSAELKGLQQNFDPDFLASDRPRATPWNYVATIAASHTFWLRNLNGSITVEPGEGRSVEVQAERSYRHSAPESVQILTSESSHGVTVCAVWPGKSTECGPDGHYTTEGGLRGNDVAVSFTVRLPRGVKLDASTINGSIDVTGVAAPVGVGTVNGDISVETSLGPVKAATVNGDVSAVIRGFAAPGDVKVATVHGDATVELPFDVNAVVDGHTVTGDITTDFPLLTVTGKFASHNLAGTLGKGGRKIHLAAVAGDVAVRRLDSAAVEVTSPPSPPVPPRARGTRRPRSGTP